MANRPYSSPFRIFVGWDSREAAAYDVCGDSLLRNTSIPLLITPLKQAVLRRDGLYTRADDPLASTEFTYTRFLVPHLSEYDGWALFCDCDFLWTADVAGLLGLIDDRYALMCVHHDHRPPESSKFCGAVQTQYPRKNWSSMMLVNCGHPANAGLTPDVVNAQTGSFLHRFQWLNDDLIGVVPETWNWLEGWSAMPVSGVPKAIHYTRGGPWFPDWAHVDYAGLWLQARDALYGTRPRSATTGAVSSRTI